MADADDDSWEAAAQAALKIHRRVASAVRDRDRDRTTTGTRTRKVRSKATTGSRLNGKARPTSAPGGFQRRSAYTPPAMLVPSLEGIPTSGISLAELEACAILPRQFERESPKHKHTTRLGQSRSAGIIDGARPGSSLDYHGSNINITVGPTNTNQAKKKSKMPSSPQLDVLFDRLQRLGPATAHYARQEQEQEPSHGASPGTAASSPALMTMPGTNTDTVHHRRSTSRVGRAFDDPHIAARHRPGSAGGGGRLRAQGLHGCRVALAEHLAARKRENELGRSDVSVRFLREHARKTLDEDNTFARALRAEVKAMEDIQLESIQRVTQRCRDVGAGFLYLPHRVGGKLHVLKVESYGNYGEAGQGDDDETGAGPTRGTTAALESYGKVLSVEAFMKEDFSRLKQEPSQQSRGGTAGKSTKARPTSAVLKEQQKKGEPGKVIVQARPNAAETCRDLHQLIRDTAGLVEALTAQAAELEGQGWNREAGAI